MAPGRPHLAHGPRLRHHLRPRGDRRPHRRLPGRRDPGRQRQRERPVQRLPLQGRHSHRARRRDQPREGPARPDPRNVQHAVLAAEDRDYYSEDAIDVKAMLRAGWNTLTGKGKQGGSTITQQYVKNYYLGQERTVVRKTKEFFISVKLDREKSKDEIFEGYLNTSYFGRNAYGIQAAAHAYYGKNVEDLDTGEGAYLASLLSSPSAYDVVVRPDNKPAAVARWDYVLNGMVRRTGSATATARP
ncbi:biosynthetic peptidoglycan transglycosylase [Streptomyces sp. M10(2022)]